MQNKDADLLELKLTAPEVAALRVSDFEFSSVPKEDKQRCRQIKTFIERHEWLGKLPTRPTHRFIATYKGQIAGAIVMATPNTFSSLLGKENRDLEKLISRGACISWSPKNLGSALVMYAVRWMVQNTPFRFFTAYSDTEARELGTIYQACNFIYLGQGSGTRYEYYDPQNPGRGWFSDRLFRKSSKVRKFARTLEIEWQPEWSCGDKVFWDRIPSETRVKIKFHARHLQRQCIRRRVPPKHKYVHILGRSKSETRALRKIFADKNPELTSLPYPKQRGPRDNTAANIVTKKEETLTLHKQNCRPQMTTEDFKYLSVKEAASMLGVSAWTIYKLIGSDADFPAHNIGMKKKFVIDPKGLRAWMESRSRKQMRRRLNIPSGQELLNVKGEKSA